jgi:hypothetical protein
MKQLEHVLRGLATPERYLFSAADLHGAFPEPRSMDVLLSRAELNGLLKRICRGIYLYPFVDYPRGHVLFHTAARLRASEFVYISLETALSDVGIISQIPINTITLMTSGRGHTITCGDFGRIEFTHTARRPNDIADQLAYDPECRLWRASPALAMRDMRVTRRNKDLINWEVAHELV